MACIGRKIYRNAQSSHHLGIRLFRHKPTKVPRLDIKTKSEIVNTSGSAIGQTLISIGNGVLILFLVPVYVLLYFITNPFFWILFTGSLAKANKVRLAK